jgi:hypothetical protein
LKIFAFPTMKHSTCCYLLLILSAGSCITPRAYMMSPMDVNSSPYHSLPTTADSNKSATYASITFSGGGSNQELRDGVLGGRGDIHRAYQFGHFQAYFGGGLSLGNYAVKDSYHYGNYYYSNYGLNDTTYHFIGSNKFFGSYGLYGGMNLVIPFGNGRGEWRVIGFETSFNKEFGDYLQFRKTLPDSVADIVATYDNMFTLGGTSEIIGISRHGTEIGYKWTLGSVLFSNGNYYGDQTNSRPYYFSQSLHVTRQRITGFIQFNIGTHAANFQFGVNYKVSKN